MFIVRRVCFLMYAVHGPALRSLVPVVAAPVNPLAYQWRVCASTLRVNSSKTCRRAFPVLSCPALPVLSCPVLSCPVLSCPVLSFIDFIVVYCARSSPLQRRSASVALVSAASADATAAVPFLWRGLGQQPQHTFTFTLLQHPHQHHQH